MKLKICLLTVLIALVLCPACKGAGTEYLFRLVPEATDFTEASGLDAYPICQAEGVYVTDNFDLVRSLDRQGALVYYEENGPVILQEYARDMKTLAGESWSRAILGADYAAARGNEGDGARVGMIDSGVSVNFEDYSDSVIVPGVNYCAPQEPEEPKSETETPEVEIRSALQEELPSERELWKEYIESESWKHGLSYDTMWTGRSDAWKAFAQERHDTADEVSHGTFAASILFSQEVGLAPSAELVPLKCFTDKDNGSIDAICEAIYDAVDVYHCDVINMSFGVKEDYETLKDAVSYAYDHGVILVASAGNIETGTHSTGNDPVLYPAAYEQVIAVGSLDRNKVLASHSSQNGSIWVTAPGVAVRGLSMKTGSYISGYGTSYAAPFVSAAAALSRSARADLSPKEFRVLLAKTAEDLGETGRDTAYGYGMMNLGLLLAAVAKDGESMIPSYYNGTLCLSLWLPQAENSLTLLARYETSGRFYSLEELSGMGMNNLPLTEEAPKLQVMRLDRDTAAPIGPAIRYGGGDLSETTE